MSWNKIRFGDLYLIESRNGLSKPSKVRGSGYKMINMGELFANDRIYDIPMELVPLNEDEKSKAKVECGDLLFARQSLVLEGAGKCSIVMKTSELTVFESHIIRVRLKEIADPMFYYYYFKSSFSPVKTIVSQCAQAGIRGSDLQELIVAFPDLVVQKRIASILSRYDDFIENSQKQILLMEEAVERIYLEWFVKKNNQVYKENVNSNELPNGWKIDRADSFFDVTIGKTPPRAEKQWFVDGKNGIKWVSISDMGKSGTFIYNTSEGLTNEAVKKHNMKLCPKGTVLVSFKLTVGRVAITTEDMCTNEAIAHFYIDDEKKRAYTYLFLKCFEYDTLGNTSSISKAVNSKIIKAMPFIMPSDEVLDAFSKAVDPYFNAISVKQMSILKAKEARDRLLSKLMNGEIEV